MLRLIDIMDPCKFYKQKFSICISKLILQHTPSVRHKSYYLTLGLNSKATAKDIKEAYYKLSQEFHPDKNEGSEESTHKFREISEAYEVLSNPEKRKKYDGISDTHSRYYDYRDVTNYYKPSRYRNPYTGKTKDFNYDEHYRRHYEDFEKYRQAEHEYFKQRWRADFHRRYPTAEEYYRNRYKDESYGPYSKKMFRSNQTVYLFTLWGIILFVYICQEFNNPDHKHLKKTRPIYYEVQNNVDHHEENK